MRSLQAVGLALGPLLMLGVGVPRAPVLAQELSPRAFWPAPSGTRAAIVGHSYSFGDTITDPSFPIDGVDSGINTTLLGYAHTTTVFGRTTTVALELPDLNGTTTGKLADRELRGDFGGWGDLSATVSVNLLGAPAMDREAFADLRRMPRPLIGASLRVVAPSGDYDGSKALNVSANRWAAKFELGLILPLVNRWLLEAEAGTWQFGDNDDFLGLRREQKRLRSLELHLVNRIRPGFWASLNSDYYWGGTTLLDNELQDDLKRNWTVGGTLVFPFTSGRALKLGFSTGKTLEAGKEFNQLIASYTQLL